MKMSPKPSQKGNAGMKSPTSGTDKYPASDKNVKKPFGGKATKDSKLDNDKTEKKVKAMPEKDLPKRWGQKGRT